MDRRVRPAWLVRQRFRLFANLATGAGLVCAVAVIAAARPATPAGWLQFGFATGAAGVLLVGAMAPRLAVRAVWRVVRWRNHEEWG